MARCANMYEHQLALNVSAGPKSRRIHSLFIRGHKRRKYTHTNGLDSIYVGNQLKRVNLPYFIHGGFKIGKIIYFQSCMILESLL